MSFLRSVFQFGRSSTFFALTFLGIAFGLCSGSLQAQFPKDAFDSLGEDQIVPLDGTQRLSTTSDIASDLVDGVDRFLLKHIAVSVSQRKELWPAPVKEGLSNSESVAAYLEAIQGLRSDYGRRIGLVDVRKEPTEWVLESALTPVTLERGFESRTVVNMISALDDGVRIEKVRWSVLDGWDGCGLLLIPKEIRFGAVLIPDAGQTPEQLCGAGPDANSDGLVLAKAGGLVVIPQVASRHREARSGRAIMTDQEFLYRSAFILGRHLLGYHVQQNQSAIDLLSKVVGDRPIVVAGWGEGGWIALATGAIDTRVDHTLVSGHFGAREGVWQEPIHRNVHGLLKGYGDAQLAALIAPRNLWIDSIRGPTVTIGGDGGAPGILTGPSMEESRKEMDIAAGLLKPWGLESNLHWIGEVDSPRMGQISDRAASEFLTALLGESRTVEEIRKDRKVAGEAGWSSRVPVSEDRAEWLKRLDRWQQRTLDLIQYERDAHWKGLDTSSMEKFQSTVEPYRKEFREEVIGSWDLAKLDPKPRTRLVYEREKYRGYEVVLDVYEDVIAYGVLLVPKSNEPIAKRPCVVFQHGLEGRPTDTIVKDHPAYHDVSARLAEQGYVVFAPQNLYLFTDRFRTLQRKSNLLGKTLFSTIIAQHEQLVRWLAARPEVDPNRIAFYGLSYGGKSAMRIPALVPEYCLSICSADFNDWVWKNASTSSPYSYVWTMEYEIFEFDLGRKFNYAEMATLIAPRPFMVERGHDDGVAPDERVGLEFAKVRRMYASRLGIPERTEIEWFNGPHTIHGVGTFEFLKKHLQP